MAKKMWLSKLQQLEGAVSGDYNPFSNVIRSPSPSVNFCFGNSWGLPLGYSMVLYGPPKAGKTVMVNAMIGQMHQDDPDAIAIKFDTEMRETAQLTKGQSSMWGIDSDRYQAYAVNSPVLIFDRIEKEISSLCDEGAPIKLVIIDSITGIRGRRDENADTVDTMQVGDHALTVQHGLKRILATQRKHRIAVILTAHVRAEMDIVESKRLGNGPKVKMAASWGLQHYAEYFMYVEANRNKEGRSTLLGQEFRDEDLQDIRGNGEKFAHKIHCQMKDSSCGPKGRNGEFTLDYTKGIINVYEEVFLLGIGRGVIEKPNQTSYAFKDRKWTGKPAMLEALRADTDLQAAIIKELKIRDLAGYIPEVHEEMTDD